VHLGSDLLAPVKYDPAQDTWELYYLPDDFTQANDLAKENPDKLKELQALFMEEAEKYKVLPLLGGMAVFFGILPPMPTNTKTTFYGDVENVAGGMIPRVYGHSYAIEADLTIPDGGAEGVIVAEADEMGGFSLWVDSDGVLHHTYSTMAVNQYKQVATEPLPTGEVTVRMQFDADTAEPGTGGTVTLWANDEKIGEGRMDHTVALRFTFYAGMDIGRDNGMTVDPAYRDKAPYAFTGTVKKVVFDLKPQPHEDEQKLHETAHHGGIAAGMAG
jgi:arylsulfatase